MKTAIIILMIKSMATKNIKQRGKYHYLKKVVMRSIINSLFQTLNCFRFSLFMRVGPLSQVGPFTTIMESVKLIPPVLVGVLELFLRNYDINMETVVVVHNQEIV